MRATRAASAATSGSTSICCSRGLTGTRPNAGAARAAPTSRTIVSTTSSHRREPPDPDVDGHTLHVGRHGGRNIRLGNVKGVHEVDHPLAGSGSELSPARSFVITCGTASSSPARAHTRTRVVGSRPASGRARGTCARRQMPPNVTRHRAREGSPAPTRPVPRAATRSIRRGDSRGAWLLRGSRRSPAGWRRASGAPRRSNARLAPRPRDG